MNKRTMLLSGINQLPLTALGLRGLKKARQVESQKREERWLTLRMISMSRDR
jgi:hypothetical protein